MRAQPDLSALVEELKQIDRLLEGERAEKERRRLDARQEEILETLRQTCAHDLAGLLAQLEYLEYLYRDDTPLDDFSDQIFRHIVAALREILAGLQSLIFSDYRPPHAATILV